MRREPVIIFGDGRQTRDYIYVADTVQATLELAGCEEAWGQVVNLGSGVEISILEVVEAIGVALGCKPTIEFRAARPGDVRRHVADVSLAKRLVGFAATTPFKVGMSLTVGWYQSLVQSEAFVR